MVVVWSAQALLAQPKQSFGTPESPTKASASNFSGLYIKYSINEAAAAG